MLRVDRRNQVLISGGQVVLGNAAKLGDKPPENAVFLGRLADGGTSGPSAAALEGPDDPHTETEVLDLRRAGQIFDDVSAQLVATATALLNWHDNARFSAVDGAPTKSIKAGWARVNAANGHEEFPRIDPAVICLVHDGHDRAVLARQTVWPERLFSMLAGFVEAGESFESCVEREIAEEVGLTVTDVQYLGSQPWPFPRSLMVGFHAHRRPGAGVLVQRRRDRRGGVVHPSRDPRGARRRRLEQRLAVAAAAAGFDLHRPRDHRILGRAGLTDELGLDLGAARVGQRADRRRTSASAPSDCRR